MQKEAKRGKKCAIMGFEPVTSDFQAACATTELGCRLYDARHKVDRHITVMTVLRYDGNITMEIVVITVI